ncbi:putative phosphatase [Erysiphe neolycopersici]|uniref:Putative phosphatase n=1 Tax=Erysiphe neolycopersici TaxID=212602 RepID=A0A420H6V9_9PEZI|nr:putative phosphatase [Erysiphe neolycopersici]
MKLLLIRHGETVDNVSGIYAGSLDSSLTNHGLIQTDKLGRYLQKNGYQINQIFSSDLQRAFLTAHAIQKYQINSSPSITRLKHLREQDLGFFEGRKISSQGPISKLLSNNVIDEKVSIQRKMESTRSLDARADIFIDNYLLNLVGNEAENYTIAIVSHGIFLGRLWRALLKRFSSSKIRIQSDCSRKLTGPNLKYLGNWSNTGYLEFDILEDRGFHPRSKTDFNTISVHDTSDVGSQQSSSRYLDRHKCNNPIHYDASHRISESRINHHLLNFFIEVRAINSQDHLNGLQKLRGGTGNLKHDPSQKTIDKYFPVANKKQRVL